MSEDTNVSVEPGVGAGVVLCFVYIIECLLYSYAVTPSFVSLLSFIV